MDARRPGSLHALIVGQARDFAAWPVWGPRLVDETACLAAVLLAIGAARHIGVGNVGWAAFSAYMVIRPSIDESLYRGASRMLGTAGGAMLACVLAPAALSSTMGMSAALALFGAGALYLALLDRRTYGFLFAGMAFAMVLIDGMEHSNEAIGAFARARCVEVCVGSGAALLVSAVSAFVMHRPPHAAQGREHGARRAALRLCHPAAFKHALQAAVALGLIPCLWRAFHIHALSQSSTTILAVLMVPLLDPAAPPRPASKKLQHRFIGCGMGALLATAILVLSHASPTALTLGVCFGVLAGRHVENGALDIGYVGTQFALTFLVVLVPDSGAAVDVHAGLSRLLGVVVGMALLEPVRLLFRHARQFQG